MSSFPNSTYCYTPLPDSTFIRILILGPGKPEDVNVYCYILVSKLWDQEQFPHRPVESLFVARRPLPSGEEGMALLLRLHVESDSDSEDSHSRQRIYPPQRYEALSYVWGERQQQQQQYIFLDDKTQRFPVTQNLYELLRSLRRPQAFRKLWVDAICINQSDHEEKKIQLSLLRRIYQQAEKVIAYLPLSLQDQKNVDELVRKIFETCKLYKEEEKAGSSSSSGQQEHTRKKQFIFGREVVKSTINFSTDLPEGLYSGSPGLEDFGIPVEDRQLWDSWRLTFASPYFRRIWILQEVALGQNLRFWTGNAECDAEVLFEAHSLLGLYSSIANMGYMIPTRLDCLLSEDLAATVVVGTRNAAKMYIQRRSAQSDRPADRLIDILATVTTFQATDARDRIYALLGLTCDSAFFAQHVSYAPWDSAEKIFLKFARLFVEKGEGIDLLLQAGLGDEEDNEWPSWVPNWDKPSELSGRSEVIKNPGSSSPRMRVDESGQTLHISGVTFLDEIKITNDSAFETLQTSPGGTGIAPFILSFIKGLDMVFEATSSIHRDEIHEALLHVLAQSRSLDKSSISQGSKTTTATSLEDNGEDNVSSGPSLNSAATPSHGTTQHKNNADQVVDEREQQGFRMGFDKLLEYIVILSKALSLGQSKEISYVFLESSPTEHWHFLRRAMDVTMNRRFCVTEGRYIGLGPKNTRVGDSVVVFEGSSNHFILRRIVKPKSVEGYAGEEEKYRLVGPAYFYKPESVGKPPTTVRQEIMII
ncbi:HET-domain-containing protein [Xylaria curta]|nr:HET-domain-containing protein [Xylaria curta]